MSAIVRTAKTWAAIHAHFAKLELLTREDTASDFADFDEVTHEELQMQCDTLPRRNASEIMRDELEAAYPLGLA